MKNYVNSGNPKVGNPTKAILIEASEEERAETIPRGSTLQVEWKCVASRTDDDIVRSNGKPLAVHRENG